MMNVVAPLGQIFRAVRRRPAAFYSLGQSPAKRDGAWSHRHFSGSPGWEKLRRRDGNAVVSAARRISSTSSKAEVSQRVGSRSAKGASHLGVLVGVSCGVLLVAIGVGASLGQTYRADVAVAVAGTALSSDGTGSAEWREGLGEYSLAEIKSHGPESKRPWVTHGTKVYDITDWVSAHPGGDVILRAAGGSIDGYWDIFTIHKQPHVDEILDNYIIGYVARADLVDGKVPAAQLEDPFVDDPSRDGQLVRLTSKPMNAETPPPALAGHFLTPNHLFYVRNHLWVPRVEPEKASMHALTIELVDGSTKTYTLGELKAKFPSHKITAALQCSGNRRRHMSQGAAATNGLQWNVGGISCAEWEGVRLVDVLKDAGLERGPSQKAKHVWFTGLETYGASIPLETAVDPRADVLLAHSMNGQTIPRDHGFPLRVVVPGHVAARSVKWLSHIVLSDEESPSQWQRRDYKCFGPNETKPDWDAAPAIQEMPITSAITLSRVEDDGLATLQGYAYSGGGRQIIRVDVSLDGGKTWNQAELVDKSPKENGNKGADHKHWAWKRWRYQASLPASVGPGKQQHCTTAVVKATDDSYNSQPESHGPIYNTRGNLATAWHAVKICPPCREGTAATDKNRGDSG